MDETMTVSLYFNLYMDTLSLLDYYNTLFHKNVCMIKRIYLKISSG